MAEWKGQSQGSEIVFRKKTVFTPVFACLFGSLDVADTKNCSEKGALLLVPFDVERAVDSEGCPLFIYFPLLIQFHLGYLFSINQSAWLFSSSCP